MARPTILIGIGSGGLRSIEAAWKLSQEIPAAVGAEQRPLVEYIYLETDASNHAASKDIVCCPLTLSDPQSTKHAIESDPTATSAWLHNQTISTNVMNGAGGSPVVGRMTIWDKKNRDFFVNALNTAVARLNRSSLETPLVYVVGSFGGGTGSGTFLDIAYIIRDCLANRVEIQGLFMIPNLGISDKVIYSNSVCCIKELDFYNNENHEFSFKWNANPPKGYEKQNTPYDLVQVISAAYNSDLATVTYSQLHEEAGLFLYLNMLGLYDVRRKSLVDASGNIIVSKYTTYGISALHYPENEIKEILANRFASELLGNIVDETHYYDKDTNKVMPLNAAVPAIRNKVMRTFDLQFEKIVEQWCYTLEIVDNTNPLQVEMHIENLAAMLASGNSSYDEKRKTLYAFFKVGGEYHRQLNTRFEAGAQDALVELIIKIVRDALQDYHNINVAVHALDAIENSIDKILRYWQANGYQKDPNSWNTLLRQGILEDILPMPWTFKIQFEAANVYKDRIRYKLLYGLAMHIFSERLDKILSAIRGNQDASGNRIVVKDTQGNALPSKTQLDAWKTLISCVKNDTNPAYNSCDQVDATLTEKLSKSSNGNIEYLFPEGTLDDTLRKIKGTYFTNHTEQRSIVDITGNADLYTFLNNIKQSKRIDGYEDEIDLYEKVTRGYFVNIDTGTFSVSEAISDASALGKLSLIVNKAKIPHLPINPTGRNAQFQDHKNIPHILAGFDGASGDTLGKINTLLIDNNIQGFEVKDDDRDKLSHIGLNNWLIFFKEFGRMSDDRPFNLIDDLRDFKDFSTYFAADMQNSGMNERDYHEKRMPYLNYSICQSLAQQHIQTAGVLYQNLEWENAVQEYKHAMFWDMSNQMPANQIQAIQNAISKEKTHDKFDRYMSIAKSYSEQQNYQKARYYYDMADNILPGDAYVQAQRNNIDNIALRVNELLSQGDQMCINANIDYDRCVGVRDLAAASSVAQQYQEILSKYEDAQLLSKFDANIKHKISNIRKRIQNLNDL